MVIARLYVPMVITIIIRMHAHLMATMALTGSSAESLLALARGTTATMDGPVSMGGLITTDDPTMAGPAITGVASLVGATVTTGEAGLTAAASVAGPLADFTAVARMEAGTGNFSEI